MKEIRTVFSLEEREEVENLLIAGGIEYKVMQDRMLHENVYTSNTVGHQYKIAVPEAFAPQALEILNAYYDAADDSESILQQFDDSDLIEIITYPKEYSATKVNKAKAILIQRGFIGEDIESLVLQRITTDNQPQTAGNFAINAGYVLALLGGLLGFAIGWFLYFAKTRHTVTKQKYYAHDKRSRNHGRNIMVLGVVFWVFVFLYFPYFQYYLGSLFPM